MLIVAQRRASWQHTPPPEVEKSWPPTTARGGWLQRSGSAVFLGVFRPSWACTWIVPGHLHQ